MFDNDISMGTQNRHGGGGATFKNIFENPVLFLLKGSSMFWGGRGFVLEKVNLSPKLAKIMESKLNNWRCKPSTNFIYHKLYQVWNIKWLPKTAQFSQEWDGMICFSFDTVCLDNAENNQFWCTTIMLKMTF